RTGLAGFTRQAEEIHQVAVGLRARGLSEHTDLLNTRLVLVLTTELHEDVAESAALVRLGKVGAGEPAGERLILWRNGADLLQPRRERWLTARNVRLVDADLEVKRTDTVALAVVVARITIHAAYLGCSTGRRRIDSFEHREAIVSRSVTAEDTRGRRSRDAERHDGRQHADHQPASSK